MQDAVELAKQLQGTPDLLPWVVFIVICTVLYANRSMVMEYFRARIGYWRSMKDVNAILPEVIRNNTAAMNMCTEAFKDWKGDRGENRRMLEFHEQSSKERFDGIHDDLAHIQNVINRMDETLTSNSKHLGLIEDRTRDS